jgi:hypothetical protein
MNKYTETQKKAIYAKKWQREKELKLQWTEEQRIEANRKHNEYTKNWYNNLSPEDRLSYDKRQHDGRIKDWSEMSNDERIAEIMRHRERRQNFTFEQLEYERERGRTNVLKNKLRIINHYTHGEMRCMNPDCEVPGGTRNIWALSVDHINGGGVKQTEELKRTGTNFYAWIIKNNYPDGLQILCMNCNTIKKVQNKEDYKTRQPRRKIEPKHD